uniref:uncharacterized protein LOC122601031 n=1 Tax=Erigeron canadensis TaxID=72917 RepID=UPI001CB928F0|nr:uncharacterized protein LOC122601031 [Erigeron canadensis]
MTLEQAKRMVQSVPLPENDIILEILLRLPVEAVCKPWLSLIFDPFFIKSHLKLSSTRIAHHRLIFFNDSREKTLQSCPLNDVLYDKSVVNSLDLVCPSDLPLKSHYAYPFRIVGSCDGLNTNKEHNRNRKNGKKRAEDMVKPRSLKLGDLGEWLCVLCDYRLTCANVWVMKIYGVQDSWTKLVSISYPANNCIFRRPFFISSDGTVLLQSMWILVVCDTKDGSSSAVENWNGLTAAYTFVESLVSPYPSIST